MTQVVHNNLMLDTSNTTKSRLYQDDKLVFMGDGYKAILQFIRLSDNAPEVMEKFRAQLEMREKPKFKSNDLDALRKEAHEEEAQRKAEMLKKKKPVIRRPGGNDRRLI
tara:strand:- start:4706 stop:5032 length:327 start_codon:yes stop_codon:yes gene_type:complete